MEDEAKTLERIRELHRRFAARTTEAREDVTSAPASLWRNISRSVAASSSRISARLSAFFSL